MMASAYVNGLQSHGVGATIKHFVANDQEHERTAADSVVSERALREIYLYPFMMAQKLAKPLAFMTSYVHTISLIFSCFRHCSSPSSFFCVSIFIGRSFLPFSDDPGKLTLSWAAPPLLCYPFSSSHHHDHLYANAK